jgi:hypothetical protein
MGMIQIAGGIILAVLVLKFAPLLFSAITKIIVNSGLLERLENKINFVVEHSQTFDTEIGSILPTLILFGGILFSVYVLIEITPKFIQKILRRR